ncbi:MAG: PIG-L family deacetylase [Blastocatellia bacterium]
MIAQTAILALSLIGVRSSFNPAPAGAQVQEIAENRGAAAAWQALLRLRTTATVLHTTAHPDDEDAGLLTWLARGQGARAGLLTINRGEGGANLIGPELYDALGILRTEELLAAGRFYGLDRQMFTRMTDFGFSKRLDETLEHWGKENVLGEMVRAVRAYRPDIIVSRFHGKARDGHGNHQAAGLMSAELFRAAADPNRFPEQIREGLRAWQARKLYLSVRESEPSTLKIDVGQYDPMLGRSYREIASAGYALHRSQSMGSSRPAPGASFSSLQLAESVPPATGAEKSLFDGLDTTIAGLGKLAGAQSGLQPQFDALGAAIDGAIAGFDARRPWARARELVAGMAATRGLIEMARAAQIEPAAKDHLLFLLGNKEREFNDAMNKALGMTMEVLVDPARRVEGPMAAFTPRETFNVTIPGQKFSVTMSVVNRSPVRPDRAETILAPPSGWRVEAKPPEGGLPVENSRLRAQFDVEVPADAATTRPHWSRADEIREHVYRYDRAEYAGLPFPPPDVSGVFNYEIEGVRFSLAEPALTSFLDAPYGEQRRLLTVAPAINVSLAPRVGIVPAGASQSALSVTVNLSGNVKGEAAGRVRLQLPDGWISSPAQREFRFSTEGERSNFVFTVQVPRVTGGTDYRIRAVAEFGGREYTEGYQVIAHRDLEPRHLYRPAAMIVRAIDAQIAPNLTVGYVMGVGDEVPRALEQLGVKVAMLGGNELAGGELKGFDAILIGIRATAVRKDLRAYSKRLLDYVEQGGHLIYQYQTPEFDAAPYGPYPCKLTPRAEEVSEEDSKVKILDPAHPFFTGPNRITEADFDGWVEERGSKWMTTWDERYKPLLECNDRGQPPQRGGMMTAEFGKGTFTYAAYAFYRQLPAGVQGAYRLFANIISLKKR